MHSIREKVITVSLICLMAIMVLPYVSHAQGPEDFFGNLNDIMNFFNDLKDLEIAIKIRNAYLEIISSIPAGETKTVYLYIDRANRKVEWSFIESMYDWSRFATDPRDPRQRHMPLYFRVPVTGTSGISDGGICPTFIQPPPGKLSYQPVLLDNDENLFARIAIPTDNCLLRSDIPIYGVAGGSNFERYRVEYGVSTAPTEWYLIEESTTPQQHFEPSQVPNLLQGDLDLRGNLTTWNTGLKNWEHLPWHPASDTIDLNGVYTIRLTVFGRDGKTVEDRVVGEVGRAIAQCLPGIALSADKNVVMHFHEQSLMAPFRVYAIRPVTSEAPEIPPNQKLVGEVYQIREGGDHFIKPVILEMSYGINESAEMDLSSFGIFSFDNNQNSWVSLGTTRDENKNVLRTDLIELPSPKAYYAILSSTGGLAQSTIEPSISANVARKSLSDRILIRDDFQSNLGEWSDRNAEAGASVTRICEEQENANCYVKVTNKNFGGNFACNLIASPFDAREYPIVSFDYKIEKDTKIDFYVRVAGRWYNIGFTDVRNEYRNKDVNISYLGQIPEIVPDDHWHHATFDLYDLLRRKTGNTLVESIILADWNVGGYMKLEFGTNAKGASVCFDNFMITRDTLLQSKPIAIGDSSLVEDFEDEPVLNRLGNTRMIFSSPGITNCSVQLIDRKSQSIGGINDHCLSIKYDVQQKGDYFGWMTSLKDANLNGSTYLNFEIFYQGKIPKCLIGLKDKWGHEIKVPLEPYIGKLAEKGWRLVTIPMVVFSSLNDFAFMDNLSISFEEKCGSASGFIQIDNIQFIAQPSNGLVLKIGDFQNTTNNLNALGSLSWTFANGAAAIGVEKQKRGGFVKNHPSTRISYGGSIGLDLGEAGFSYAGWATGLNGIDISSFDSLRFAISGQKGNEEFNVYLDDGNKRWPVAITKYGTIAKAWNNISIPLREYIAHGIDLTRTSELQFVFEWKEMSGTIWISDISLIRNPNTLPATIGYSGGKR